MEVIFNLKTHHYILQVQYNNPNDKEPTDIVVQFNGKSTTDVSHEQHCKDISTALRRFREAGEQQREEMKTQLKKEGIEIDDFKKQALGPMELRDFTPEELTEKPELCQRLKDYYALVVQARQCLYMANKLRTDDLPFKLTVQEGTL